MVTATETKTGQTFAYHLAETGRIRIGHLIPIKEGKNAGKPTPTYLQHFRLTSNSRAALEMAQARYRGEIREWTVRPEWKGLIPAPAHKWELYTECDVLDCIIHPSTLMHSTFERWQGGACVLRCDGQFITKDATGTLTGMACVCPSDAKERKRLAKLKPPQGCEDHSRISVVLEGLKVGKWRIDTGGFYAPAETRGLQALLAECQLEGMLIPAQMRLERRTDVQKEGDKTLTRHYSCIVLEPRHAVEQLMLAGSKHLLLLPPGIEAEGKSLPEHIADLYGDPATVPAGEDGAAYIAQIEAAILAQPGGKLDVWYAWAEKQRQKTREAFTVQDWEWMLDAVRAAARVRTRDEAQPPAVSSTASTIDAEAHTSLQTPPEAHAPETPPEGTQGPPEATEGELDLSTTAS